MFADLSTRTVSPEIMDDPRLGTERHHAALRGLARLNRVSGITRPLWRAVRSMRGDDNDAPLRILDVATGAGDIPIELAKRSQREGIATHVFGCDISPRSIEHAQDRARRAGASVDFFVHDILAQDTPGEWDVLTCSMFLHHLSDEEMRCMLRNLTRAARVGFVITDLRRTRLGYALAYLASRSLTRSDVVRHDALLSVRAAMTISEVRAVASEFDGQVRIDAIWPERFLLTWRRSAG